MLASYGGFLKWWYPTTQQPWVFLLKMGVFWVDSSILGNAHMEINTRRTSLKRNTKNRHMTFEYFWYGSIFFACAWSTNLQLFKEGDLGACDSCCVTWPCALSNHFISMVDCHTSQRVSYPYHVIMSYHIHITYSDSSSYCHHALNIQNSSITLFKDIF